MSSFTKVILTVPVAHVNAANRCAAIFDFDTGGASTFGACRMSATGQEPATHYMVSTAIKPHYIPMLLDPVQASAALNQLAALYGRTPPAEQDVIDFCDNVQVSEPGADPWQFVDSLGLQRVVVEEPT